MNTCPKCGESLEDYITWPVKVAGEIVDGGCQNCWETECAESWWEYMRLLSALVPVYDDSAPGFYGPEDGAP